MRADPELESRHMRHVGRVQAVCHGTCYEIVLPLGAEADLCARAHVSTLVGERGREKGRDGARAR
eukprot:636850-Rhodomonas_salina.1